MAGKQRGVAQPSPPSASRWPERSPSLGGGRSRGNSTSAGADLLLQEFPEKFPLGLICQRIRELSFTSCESSYFNALKTEQGRACRWSRARGRGWEGARADPCTPGSLPRVSACGASLAGSRRKNLLQKANPAIPHLVLPPGYSISRVTLSRFRTWRVGQLKADELSLLLDSSHRRPFGDQLPKITFSIAPDHGVPIWLEPTEAQSDAFLEKVETSPSWAQPCPPTPTKPAGKPCPQTPLPSGVPGSAGSQPWGHDHPARSC